MFRLPVCVTSGNVHGMSTTPSQIIDAKGGPAAFAACVSRTPGAVRVWKHRDSFPRDAWPEIMRAFPEVTLDLLMKMESAQVESTARLLSSLAEATP